MLPLKAEYKAPPIEFIPVCDTAGELVGLQIKVRESGVYAVRFGSDVC